VYQQRVREELTKYSTGITQLSTQQALLKSHVLKVVWGLDESNMPWDCACYQSDL
jgi:hypothetical protein